ncbi:MAG: hypothetical protein KDC34_03425 [Saprospiraceae bacterium]|nr:hypothetical protein [Saprospiraceae bacterium]
MNLKCLIRNSILLLSFIFLPFFLLAQKLVDDDELVNQWNKLDRVWKNILLENATGNSVTEATFEIVERIFLDKNPVVIKSGTYSSIPDLEGFYFLQNRQAIELKGYEIANLAGANFLNETTQLKLTACTIKCTSRDFFSYDQIVSPGKKEIFLGKVKLGESYATEDKIKENFKRKAAFFWWSHLSSDQRYLTKYICKLPTNQTISLDNIGLIRSLFYQRVITFDLSQIPVENLKRADLEFLNILVDLRVLELENGYGLEDLKFIGALKTISVLICRNLGLRSLSGVQFLENLNTLDCSGNQITSLDPICETKHLGYLICTNNQISVLPDTFPSLYFLDARSNKIENLSGFCSMSNLKYLYLDHNPLKMNIDCLGDLEGLERLNLNNCQIDNIEWAANLRALRTLFIQNNIVDNLCPLIGLNRLEALDARGNNLKTVDCIRNISTLKELDISENEIEDITFTEALTSLEELNVAENEIAEFPELKASKIERLNISGNSFSNLSNLSEMGNLEYLNISNNDSNVKLESLPDFSEFESLSELYFSNNYMDLEKQAEVLEQVSELVEKDVLKVRCIWF